MEHILNYGEMIRQMQETFGLIFPELVRIVMFAAD